MRGGRPTRAARLRGAALALAATALFAAEARAEDDAATAACQRDTCLSIKYDTTLAEEAAALADALSVRLADRDVAVGLDDGTGSATLTVQWTVHLRGVGEGTVLMAVDSVGSVGAEELVREVPRGPDAGATAWTLALMIEEAIRPYLRTEADQGPLGAGLAIIEPPVVGGVKREEATPEDEYPSLRAIGAGLLVYRLAAVDTFLAGPRIAVEGLLTERLAGSLGAAWVGTGRFKDAGVEGSISHVPLDMLFTIILLPSDIVELGTALGFSAGFSIYQTEAEDADRTDVLFNPWVQARLTAVFHIYGPLAVGLAAGAAVVLTRDVLQNAGETVYRQDWLLPLADIQIQLWL